MVTREEVGLLGIQVLDHLLGSVQEEYCVIIAIQQPREVLLAQRIVRQKRREGRLNWDEG